MKRKLENLTREEVRSKAGPWDILLSGELDKKALGQPYNKKAVERALLHLQAFYDPQIYYFYKHIHDREEEINGL